MPSDFLEKTVEDIVFENRDKVYSRGLCPFKKYAFRQVILPSGRRIDILGFEIMDGRLYIDVYELKRDVINIEAVGQAYNYIDEINQLIKGSFKSVEPSIIMVGRRYSPIPLLDNMKTPISVYTYDYDFDGIKFNHVRHSDSYYSKNETFSLGIWGFGLGMLSYRSGNPSSISFHSLSIGHVSGDDFEERLRLAMKEQMTSVKLLPPPTIEPIKPLRPIVTDIFPLQPSWTSEFASGIPHFDIFEDNEVIDDCDFEDDEIELDLCDYESSNDDEPDVHTEDDEISLIREPINNESMSMSNLIFPANYFVAKWGKCIEWYYF